MSTPSTPAGPPTPSAEVWPPATGPVGDPGVTEQQSRATTETDESRHVTDRAKSQAREVTNTAREVTDTARQEAQSVLQESKQQTRRVLGDARDQLETQSHTQRDRLVGTLRTFGDDLARMADGEPTEGGTARDLVRQVAERSRELSDRIDGREPGELLEGVRRFARQRPGVFLFGALAAGVIAGRLTRSVAETKSQWSPRQETDDDLPRQETDDHLPRQETDDHLPRLATDDDLSQVDRSSMVTSPPFRSDSPTGSVPEADSPWVDDPRRSGVV